MLDVTNEFHIAMKASNRKVYGRIQIDYTDPYLDQSINVETNGDANTSYPNHVADGIESPKAKYASLDGSWLLDDTFALAPTPSESRVNQMGWWGNKLSGVNGVFATPYPTLTALFFARPVGNLKVVGDDKRNEYPVNFTITLLDSSDTVLYQEIVTGNDEIKWSKNIEQVTNISKMQLEISRWSEANRQVKILEFFTSIQEVYEDNDIVSLSLLEEKEVSHGSLPIGNISSNEIELQLNNSTRKFDSGNKDSHLHGLIRPNRRIKPELAVDVEHEQAWCELELNLTWEDVVDNGI